MPEALETTKRKFYKLLDNFSASRVSLHNTEQPYFARSTNASTTTLAVAEPPNKRSRFSFVGRKSGDVNRAGKEHERPASMPIAAAATVRPVSPESTNSITTTSPEKRKEFVPREELKRLVEERRARKQAEENQKLQKQPFKYAPWSHDLFLERLKTFADIKAWSPKPEALSEVAWAKRGWVTQGKDAVFCRMCEKRVVISLKREGVWKEERKWWQEEAQKELVNRYQKLVIEGHDEECLWRGHGCKDDIYRMKMADPNVWQPELRKRYQSLAKLSSALPQNIRIPPTEPGTPTHFDPERIAIGLESILLDPTTNTAVAAAGLLAEDGAAADTEPEPTLPPTINQTALVMAICGWSGVKTSGIELATCDTCFQRCGLWLYNGKRPVTSRSASTTTPTPTSTAPLTLDPISLHREYCPWKSATSQSAEGSFKGLSGYEILLSLIQFVVERHERRQKAAEIEALEAAGEDVFVEQSWDDVIAHDREIEGRLAKVRRAFTFKKKGGLGLGGGGGGRKEGGTSEKGKENRRSWGGFGSGSRPNTAA